MKTHNPHIKGNNSLWVSRAPRMGSQASMCAFKSSLTVDVSATEIGIETEQIAIF